MGGSCRYGPLQGRSSRRTGFGLFTHPFEPMPLERQSVVRPNRDTLHPNIVIDLGAGAAATGVVAERLAGGMVDTLNVTPGLSTV